MSVLVCGGAGYIGSHCVKMLCDLGEDVVVIDNLSTGYLKAIDKRATVYLGDIQDELLLNTIFKQHMIFEVIHFAAFSLVGESMKEPLKYYDNNVVGTIQLLKSMVKHNVKKIVFSSTAAVYGDHELMPITENFDTIPSNTYGETKLAMEDMMKWADVAYGIKFMALRYFNVAGAHHSSLIGEAHHPETHLIPIVLQVPLGQRSHITIFGDDYATFDGTCIRDYIHVEDLIEGHILALKSLRSGAQSNIYNLGSGSGYSVLEVIEAARRVTKHPIPVKVEARRAGDPARLIASSEKIETELGWVRRYNSIDDIIQSAWNFHQSHPNGYNTR
ncbi:MAG TPA: UDP-glucose 4-epimerase GalE [Bacilli bacterium]|mgnify:CR=1 FL=1|nr:UDP-glucose 4-epimerase GalE [Bacilli bacterium]